MILGAVIGVFSAFFYYLDSHVDKFFIFDPIDLHKLSIAAIDKHGNDTRSAMGYIVNKLHAKHPKYVNLEEEWFFNNHGGAMGAMTIIHASALQTYMQLAFGVL